MALRRMSWTSKPERALVCETLEQADMLARAMLGHRRAIQAHYLWASSQGGYVIYNEDGTRMIADR